VDKGQLGGLRLDENSGEGGSETPRSRDQFHQPSRASRLRIASARASTVLAVGHVASSKVVARIDRIKQGHANPRQQVRELAHSIT
jgi:hypothetical protein